MNLHTTQILSKEATLRKSSHFKLKEYIIKMTKISQKRILKKGSQNGVLHEDYILI